ncbi:Outer membrane efflux protein [Azotobacter vinelandii CA]|uniref:Outer membrane efflux protein n=2 Tax=Azotobacter vinelandii TaxID=354 RepID=C1DMR7_AZOVD|nr:TolC family protein [Azotobacter vinelandii]ACO77097.1 Outer membrane efflux protein [Azotobacter vinelandii DJ]AGK15488.1 Outer membrane efflux protein [Azotobacter vinelandii CA]AGK19562.1 Outer membrane efflux protein [Azotobacter vinelandii CA6]SFX94529.1 outer membrane protein, cobalt-zinc-cadmium efflux system [Azotobacter vinelandii]GLK60264.1 cation efflux system protein [Azotobacter vinelandii]
MRSRFATLAVWVAVSAAAWPALGAERLSLDDAFARVATNHPELRLFDSRGALLAAERERAALRPALVAGATLENAFGSGEARGLQGAELTLTLASVLERGGKLDARQTLARSRIDALAVEREARRLDLLAEVARRYLAMVAACRQGEIAEQDIAQRQRTLAGARRRLQAGASPESVVFSAEAALARAELEKARARQRFEAARQYLAALWGERDPRFEIAAGDPAALPEIADFAALGALLEDSPELTQFVGERRIREARLQLARSQATADLSWQAGVRRLEASDDFGMVGTLSLPLGETRRAAPEIRAAEAELGALEIEREARELSLHSTLAEAHGRYRAAQLEVRRLGDEVIPLLSRAEGAAERAYRAGAISYLEWAQLQSERTAARRQQLDAALDAQRTLIEIQRLTGQPLIAGQPTDKGNTP